MAHRKQYRNEPASTSFTITQSALGSPLQFEPALGSSELDSLINSYIPGPATHQQKRAQVAFEFLNSINVLSYTHPVSIRYQVPQVLTLQVMPHHSSLPSIASSSMRAPFDHPTANRETLSTSKPSRSLKRSRQEAAPSSNSSVKRLPGFSIMTKDGIDITDLTSRGPKTKEQRDHAALMRRLKACAACKKSKQRCDPGHHRPARSSLSTTSSATPSKGSAIFSCISPTNGYRGSISPQSSLGESFIQSPTRGFVDRTFVHAGPSFSPPLPSPRSSLSPPDFALPESLLTDSEILAWPVPNIDPEVFQLADVELNSWNTHFTAFPHMGCNNAWNSSEDTFAPNPDCFAPSAGQDADSARQTPTHPLSRVTPHVNDDPFSQAQARKSRQSGQLIQDTVHLDSFGVDLDDINRWLCSPPYGNHGDLQTTQLTHIHMDIIKDYQPQQTVHNSINSRDQDYILYRDSPQFEWELEPHLISRDIGSKEWAPYEEAETGESRKRNVHASILQPDLQEPTPLGVRLLGPNSLISGVQSTAPLETIQWYLPSPSASDGSEDSEIASSSKCNVPGASGTVHDTQNIISPNSNHAQRLSEHFGQGQSMAVQRQCHVLASENGPANEYRSAIYRPDSPDRDPYDVCPIIKTDVGSLYRIGPVLSTRTERPQWSPSEPPKSMHMLDMPNSTMSSDCGQRELVKETLGNQEPQTLGIESDEWDRIWMKRDLRRAGLLGDVLGAGESLSQMRFSSHVVTRAYTPADGVCDTFVTGAELRTISSHIPGDDGIKEYDREMLMPQLLDFSQDYSRRGESSLHEVLQSDNAQQKSSLSGYAQLSEQELWIVDTPALMLSRAAERSGRMATIMTICILMMISLLSTILLLIDGNSTGGISKPESSLEMARICPWNLHGFSAPHYQAGAMSISLEHDYGTQCRFDPGTGLGQATSRADILYSWPDQVNHMKSIDSGPNLIETNPSTIEGRSADDSSLDRLEEPLNLFQDMPRPSGTASAMNLPATKTVTSWTTHLPPRPTKKPVESHHFAASQTRYQLYAQSPSPQRFLPILKPAWSWRFNPGHLGLKITSLTIL